MRRSFRVLPAAALLLFAGLSFLPPPFRAFCAPLFGLYVAADLVSAVLASRPPIGKARFFEFLTDAALLPLVFTGACEVCRGGADAAGRLLIGCLLAACVPVLYGAFRAPGGWKALYIACLCALTLCWLGTGWQILLALLALCCGIAPLFEPKKP